VETKYLRCQRRRPRLSRTVERRTHRVFKGIGPLGLLATALVATVTAPPAAAAPFSARSAGHSATSAGHSATPSTPAQAAPSDFTITPSPGSVTVAAGSSASLTLVTSRGPGTAQRLTLSLTGAPPGATGSFSTASVLAGSPATLLLNVGASTPPGSYPLTVKGTSRSVAHTAAVNLTVAATPPARSTGPFLIKHGWDVPSPSFVHDHVASMEKMPFDGVVIAMPTLSHQVQRQVPVTYDQFRAELAPVAATHFTSLTHNFLIVYATPAGSFFDDYSIPIANFANLARAAREAGLAGVVYDNEPYSGPVWDATPGHTLAESQAQALLRGQQIVDAMRGAWPDIQVIAFHGAWASEPSTPSALSPIIYYDLSTLFPTLGSFFIGMVQSTVGTPATVVDGGEIYTLRTSPDYAKLRSWQKQGMATSPLIPQPLKATWASKVSAGFGLYDKSWEGLAMDANVWRTTLTNALATTDKYVWAYTEQYDWWGTGNPSSPVPQTWVDATRQALATTR